jgi:hypothetical protein
MRNSKTQRQDIIGAPKDKSRAVLALQKKEATMKFVTKIRTGNSFVLEHTTPKGRNDLVHNAVNVFSHLLPIDEDISYTAFANLITTHYSYDEPHTRAMVDALLTEAKEELAI